MSELSPEDRALVDAGARDDVPGGEARERVRRRLAMRLGAAAGLGAATAATKAAAATGMASKILFAVAVIGAVGAGGAALGIAARNARTPAASVAAPAASVATPAASVATPAVIVAAPAASVTTPLAGSTTTQAPTITAPAAPSIAPEVAPSKASSAGALHDAPRTNDEVAANAAPTPPPNALAEAPASPADALAEETRLLREANAATNAGDPARALALLDEHARRFPRGVLGEERDAERVLTLCAAGRTGDARAAAARFLSAHPHSTLAGRVRGSCAGP